MFGMAVVSSCQTLCSIGLLPAINDQQERHTSMPEEIDTGL